MTEPLVIFVYDHFYPDFSAGGPVTSLNNLAKLLAGKLAIRILTGNREFETRTPMSGIESDTWSSYQGVPVWYASDRASIKKAIGGLPNDRQIVFYLNGIFSYSFFYYVLGVVRKTGSSVVISPRGMLQQGAMEKGRLKKEAYLTFLKFGGSPKGSRWHATDNQELIDVKSRWGPDTDVMEIPNVPTVSENKVYHLSKKKGELRLVYFSLVAQKKNLLFILELIDNNALTNVQLDIIGPVKDNLYWDLCQQRIKRMVRPERVVYRGPVAPQKSVELITKSHVLVLPTLGENFGHAIVEGLAASRPALISDKTPWQDLAVHHAGYSLPLRNDVWIEKISEMLNWDEDEYSKACVAALTYYRVKFNFEELKSRYMDLFNIAG